MQINASQFRKDMASFMQRASAGEEVTITRGTDVYRLVPEKKPSKFERITPMEIYHPGTSDADWEREKVKIMDDWEKKWDDWEKKWPIRSSLPRYSYRRVAGRGQTP